MAKIGITETVLRDAHQSLIATRMTTDEMLPILPELDKIGFRSIECWGGATFDSCLRFLNEDPWERLRILKKNMPNTPLQMLFRGQNMLGYRHYADDVVEYFVQKSIANGIDVIRIFDALNDIRNLETAIKAAKKEGAHTQVAMSFTTGEVFTDEYYVNYAKQIENAGADSICIKDMAALLTPYRAETLVKALKKVTKLPIQLHTHYTSGLASMCLMKAAEAGVDAIDTAMSPLALGTSHAPTESMVAAFAGTEYDTGLDLVKLSELRPFFMELLSNLLSQLKQAGKEDQLTAVLEEVPRVRKDAGFPPLVTPTSQIVGTQAVFNIIGGERYKMVTKEFRAMVRGEYGKTPLPIDPEFQKMILKDQEPITCRPADLLEPELDKLKEECAEWITQEEDVLSYAQFGQVAVKFFEKRRDKMFGLDGVHGNAEKQIHPV